MRRCAHDAGEQVVEVMRDAASQPPKCCEALGIGAVRVMRRDRVVGVMVSAQDYEAMREFYANQGATIAIDLPFALVFGLLIWLTVITFVPSLSLGLVALVGK
jgi:hypothetical protein